MPVINKLNMLSITVSNMKKSKEFYVEALGLEVKKDYREDDENWWITMEFPGGGAELTLGRAAKYGAEESLRPGMLGIYLETKDLEATREALTKKGVKAGEIQDDLFGPGSDVQFFNIEDPDGNSINVLQLKES